MWIPLTKSIATALLWAAAGGGAVAQNLGQTSLRGDELVKLPNSSEHRPSQITLFYATSASEATVTRGPFTYSVAANAAPMLKAATPLVLLSHGSGGSVHTFVDLARALVQAGFVVALPVHAGDNSQDQRDVGPASWRKRPLELSATLDALAAHPKWSGWVNTQQVGVFGMSAGGHTALVMAGGVWSEARFGDHCRNNLAQDFNTCVGLMTHLNGGAMDAAKIAMAKAIFQTRFNDATALSHADARIKAVVSSVPMAAPFDASTLSTPRVPLALMRAELDSWLHPKFHSDTISAQCLPRSTCTLLANWPKGGHGSVLSPWPAELASSISPLMVDPDGFDRATELPKAFGDVAAFFATHLR